VIAGGRHSWLYEFPEYRRAVARFLARALGGPLKPDEAADVADRVPATRLPDPETPFSAIEDEPGGLRTLASVVIASRSAGTES
jgi:hypothetical protein